MNQLDKLILLISKAYPMGSIRDTPTITIGAKPASLTGRQRGAQPENTNAKKDHLSQDTSAQKPWGTRSPKTGDPESIVTKEQLPPPVNQLQGVQTNPALMQAWHQAINKGTTSLPQMHQAMWRQWNSLKAIDQTAQLTRTPPEKVAAMKAEALSNYASIRSVYDAHIAPSTANPHPGAVSQPLGANPSNEGLDQARYEAAMNRQPGSVPPPPQAPAPTGIDEQRYQAALARPYRR